MNWEFRKPILKEKKKQEPNRVNVLYKTGASISSNQIYGVLKTDLPPTHAAVTFFL